MDLVRWCIYNEVTGANQRQQYNYRQRAGNNKDNLITVDTVAATFAIDQLILERGSISPPIRDPTAMKFADDSGNQSKRTPLSLLQT